MKKWWLSVAFMSMAGCSQWDARFSSPSSTLPDGVELIETVEKNKKNLTIPYQKYRLENGLTVILHSDHSDPLVHVDMTYHVGSARETVGKSGFAHFFEHMMFQGSEHVDDQAHFRFITEAGGTLNGTTNRDRTNYFQTVPANQLEKVLWLESDRMGFLLNAVSQKKFEIQRATVKNERAERYENRPYGLIYERIGEALYPREHPYSWQPIGYVADLDRVNVEDLKDFFLQWYGPNNATLTIGGDIDTKETLAWVQRYFGEIPKGPVVHSAEKQPVTMAKDRFLTLEDNVEQPMLMMAWPTTYLGDQKNADLDVLTELLGGGQNGWLYQNLVKTGEAVEVGAYQDCGELACTVYVYALAESGGRKDLQTLRKNVLKAFSTFQEKGISDDLVDGIQNQIEASSIFSLNSVKGKVSQLAAYETFFNDPNRLDKELVALRSVTADSVKLAFSQFIDNKPNVSLSVVPKGQLSLAANTPNFSPEPRLIPELTSSKMAYRETPNTFDRYQVPMVAKSVSLSLPEVHQDKWENGISVINMASDETPTMTLQLVLPAGRRYETKNGVSALTAAMMNEATTKRSAEDLSLELDRLGSSVTIKPGLYDTRIIVSSLSKHLPQTLSLVEEKLFHPAFDLNDFERLKHQAVESSVYEQQRPSWMAGQAIREVLFKGSVFELPPTGSPESLKKLTIDDVKSFYRQHYIPSGAALLVVGDTPLSDLSLDLAFLKDWKVSTIQLPKLPLLPSYFEPKIWLVDKPNAPQSVLSLVRQSLPFDATGEAFEMQLANFNLGGNFNSRINQNLREDKGYTYGAGGYQSSGKELGMSVFSAKVRADVTAPALTELLKEMRQFSEQGLTEKELSFMRLSMGQQDALRYETPADKLQLLEKMVKYGLSPNFISERNKIIESISLERLNRLARKWFHPMDYQIIVVGDAQRLKPELEAFDLPMEVLSLH